MACSGTEKETNREISGKSGKGGKSVELKRTTNRKQGGKGKGEKSAKETTD